MFCFIPPHEFVDIRKFYHDRIKWYLKNYKESELLGWISHDSFDFFSIRSLSHTSVIPLIFFNREKCDERTAPLNKMTCDSEWYNIEKTNKEKFNSKKLSQKEKQQKQQIQNEEFLKLWEDRPYLIYMIGNDDGDKAKSFRSKEEAVLWIKDVIQSGVCDSYSDFEILEDSLLYN